MSSSRSCLFFAGGGGGGDDALSEFDVLGTFGRDEERSGNESPSVKNAYTASKITKTSELTIRNMMSFLMRLLGEITLG